MKKDLIDAINTSISFSEYFEAPLSENNIIGEMVVTIGDVTYLSIDILNGNMVKKKDVFNYLEDFIENYFEYFAIQ